MNYPYKTGYSGNNVDYQYQINQAHMPKGYYSQIQDQTHLSKQEVSQIQDHELSIDTMCHCLTLGEKYALGKNIVYGSYNICASTGEDLLRLFVREIEIFRLSYEDYVENYGEYKFPRNKSRNEIIREIMEWEQFVEPEYRKYYECLIKILKGSTNFSLKEEIRILKEKKKKKKIEGEAAKNLMSHVPVISHNTRMLAQKAENNFMKDKNYSAEIDTSNIRDQRTLNMISKNYYNNVYGEDECYFDGK